MELNLRKESKSFVDFILGKDCGQKTVICKYRYYCYLAFIQAILHV